MEAPNASSSSSAIRESGFGNPVVIQGPAGTRSEITNTCGRFLSDKQYRSQSGHQGRSIYHRVSWNRFEPVKSCHNMKLAACALVLRYTCRVNGKWYIL